MRDIISISQFTLEEILEILEAAQKVMPYAENQIHPKDLEFSNLAKVTLFFAEPSTRTLGSYKEAAEIYGFRTQEISGQEATSLMKKESFADTIRTLASQGANILVIRSKYEGAAQFAVEILYQGGWAVSVHNAGDGAHQHPTQALLNLLALKSRLGRISGFTLGLIGDLKYSRTIHSDLEVLRLLTRQYGNIKIRAVSTPETKLDSYLKEGLEIEEGDFLELLSDCDVVMVTRIQEERFLDPQELQRVRGRFVINREVLENILRPNVIIMHPLPRNYEIAPEISSDPRIFAWEQMKFGVPLRMILLRESYCHRKDKPIIFEEKMATPQIIIEEPAEERLKRNKEKGKHERYFRPIRDNGMIIDHLPLGMGDTIKRLIKQHGGLKKKNGCIHTLEGVKRLSSDALKDVIVLEGHFIPEKLYAPIAFLAPKVTFNLIQDGQFKKIKVKVTGSSISGIFKCPNSFCISNNDPEAISRFYLYDEGFAICGFCHRRFNHKELLSN